MAVLYTCDWHVQQHNALCKAYNFRAKKRECNEKCIVHHQGHAQAILMASSDDDRKHTIAYTTLYTMSYCILYTMSYMHTVSYAVCSMTYDIIYDTVYDLHSQIDPVPLQQRPSDGASRFQLPCT